uniref:Reverse transcriptase-RNase H-integrase n=1 Tax=Mycena chlorophos TaxID=658473 RepID=A0ABQ0KYH8_MYCCL|nr:reverse transcriptase-RNase H-integrase [Mycena chlorophos]
MPFLSRNKIVVDHDTRSVVDKNYNYDLLHPPALPPKPQPIKKLRQHFNEIQGYRRDLAKELKAVCEARCAEMEAKDLFEHVKPVDVVAAVHERVQVLAEWERLKLKGDSIKNDYRSIFEPIPHVDDLPTDVTCEIKVKDASETLTRRSYSSPRKYKEAWSILIKKHLDAGRIRPSNSSFASPAMLIPKADKLVLPRWVNDFRVLNSITVQDQFPLPRVDDILADCAKGKIWSKIDFTDSFFQTRLHPDSVKYTAVTTPLGLYEWLVMPQGLRNAPSIQQRRVTAALREYIGKFCHVYLDDVIIWSQSEEEHEEHIRKVFAALQKAHLYCNEKKTQLFCYEIDFLGHHVSQRGIEPDKSKVERIKYWPTPKSATNVRAFLGLVRFVAQFLPNLAMHTEILSPLTHKTAELNWPGWNDKHQAAFDAIKQLVVSADCLTTIDHQTPGDNKIFVTTDASDTRSGGILSFGPAWETARPVAFDSMTFKGAELNYPVHEKELLAIIRALKKWRTDLIGAKVYVYTDHRTLENFQTQKDLSRRQARWMEFMSQFDLKIIYVPGDENAGADALSRTNFYDEEVAPTVAATCPTLEAAEAMSYTRIRSPKPVS